MTAAVVGKGADRVRVRFHDEGVQIRTPGRIIDGNPDMASIIRWVVDHPAAQASESVTAPPGSTVGSVCELLASIAQYGVSIRVWGRAWAEAVATYEGEQVQ